VEKKPTVAILKKHEIDISLRQYFENIYVPTEESLID